MTASPTLTTAQIRQACTLLRWSSPTLSRRAKVSYDAARRARTDDAALATLSFVDVWAIRTALERAGVRFAFDAEGRPEAEMADSPSP